MQQTLAIMKPDCVKRHLVGKVMNRIYDAGFQIVAMKMLWLNKQMAANFYEEHKEKEFFPLLLEFITEGPIIVAVLQKENAVEDWRHLMGKTDPAEAAPNTIRHDFAETMRRNVVHGSDSIAHAKREISFFFELVEIFEINRDN